MAKFAELFERRIRRTIRDYELFDRKDKVLVAVSGGKDSTVALYFLHKFRYDVEAIHVDLHIGDWSKKNRENVVKFCKKYDIKLHIADLRKELGSSMCHIRSMIQSKDAKLKNCTICGVIRRWLINKKARELGATKLVTGHNLDDEAQTILMNQFKRNTKLQVGLGPKSGVIKDKMFVQRIKPLYFSTEKDIKKFSKMMKFPVIYKDCPCVVDAFRKDFREMLDKFEKRVPEVKANIVNSFLTTLPAIKNMFKSDAKMKYCEQCGEPSRDKYCYACKMFKML